MDYKGIAKAIQKERAKQNISLRELAKKSNVSMATLCFIEAGSEKSRVTTLYKVAEALNLNIDEFIK